MLEGKFFKVLKGLPTYGPLYVSVPKNGYASYSEGLVIEFVKASGEKWVANFEKGWTNVNSVFEWQDGERLLVIAGGFVYIMSPNSEDPISTLNVNIEEAFQTEEGIVICHNGIQFYILNPTDGELWQSERLSWDGIKDLRVENQLITGKSFDPTNSIQEWSEFAIDLKTKNVFGGSFREFLKTNSHLEVTYNGMLKEKSNFTKKPWWKFW